ncbi:uncharacterized protein LOC129875682 [Solanum dulcamara]|uniref:uncharacterized protein LOC129875682 n=1 Tax=Solanum dulcamara TaxID=45834 RepID=UPI002485F332|nr:uncharacterized protein LOC129875682 [Solanum dulcamara]
MDIHYLPNCPVFVFDGKNNFESWHQQMNNFFNAIGLWSFIDNEFVESPEDITLTGETVKQLEKNTQLDYRTRFYLNRKVELHVYNKSLHAKTTKEGWTHRGSTDVRKVKLQELRRQYELAQMKSTDSVKEFLTRVINIVNNMRTNGEALDQAEVVEKVLRSLSTKFHTKKTVLEATKVLNTLTFDDLEGELVTYEMSLNQQRTETIDEVLQAKETQPNRREEISNLAETNQRDQNFRGRGQGSRGNFRAHCRGIEENKGIEWFIDSDCSNHMSENKKLFIDLDESFRATVRLGDLEDEFLSNDSSLVGFTDSDWAGDMMGRKSTFGYSFYLGFGIFSWSSKKQQVVALSTTEEEYMTAAIVLHKHYG